MFPNVLREIGPWPYVLGCAAIVLIALFFFAGPRVQEALCAPPAIGSVTAWHICGER